MIQGRESRQQVWVSVAEKVGEAGSPCPCRPWQNGELFSESGDKPSQMCITESRLLGASQGDPLQEAGTGLSPEGVRDNGS